MSGLGPNGHWVRTSNPQNAKAFLQEKEMEARRREAAAARSRERRRAAMAWVRSRWQQIVGRRHG